MDGMTLKPTIIKNESQKYVIIGAIDHGMQIPQSSVPELVASLNDVNTLMMEVPEIFHSRLHPMSTEILTKASVGQVPISYLSGNSLDDEIGKHVLKYAPKNIAEVFVPCLSVRNSIQLGQNPTFDSITKYTLVYQGRFGFLNPEKAMTNYMRVLQHWEENNLNPADLDDFSYDFEKFVGSVREFELWKTELEAFQEEGKSGKIAVCVGDYHAPFVQAVFDKQNIQAPNWDTHIDSRRKDEHTPQDANFLKRIYSNLEEALRE